MTHLSLNKKLQKLTILIMWKKKLMKRLKKEKKKGVKQLKKKNKSFKQTKTLYEEKIEEKELWCKLNELNKEFQTINNIKKKQKSCLRQH